MVLSPLINTLIDIGLWAVFSLLGLAVLGLLVFAIMQIVDNPKRSVISLIGIAGLAIVFFGSYFLAMGSDVSSLVYEKTETAPALGPWIGAGLFTTYFLLASTIVSLVAAEVIRPFKK
jgi:hypothetical protein